MLQGRPAPVYADRPSTLKNFDAAAVKSQECAKTLGAPVVEAYKAHLDLSSVNPEGLRSPWQVGLPWHSLAAAGCPSPGKNCPA